VIVHWDEVSGGDLGEGAGTLKVGLLRLELAAGETAAQADPNTEEILFVLAGSGSTQHHGNSSDVHPGDCFVRPAPHEAHTLRAGEDGLSVLAFVLPVTLRPFARPDVQAMTVVNVGEVEPDYEGEVGKWVVLARKAGALRAGLNWGQLEPGRSGASPHSHSADEEIFVILEGGGTLELWPSPVRAEDTEREKIELRAGHVISRPPSTGIAHSFRAGEEGMTFLAYGTREPNDVCYYPGSNKIYWRGVGLIARLEPVGYDDGEPED
jgi:uncharacterized cupin superfamily protein